MRAQKHFDDFATDDLEYDFQAAHSSKSKSIGIYTEEFSTHSVSVSTQMQLRSINVHLLFYSYLYMCLNQFQVRAEQIRKAFDQEESKNQEPTLSQFDQTKLQQFLKKIYPSVISALNESGQLKLLQNFQPLSEISSRETVELYTLSNQNNKALEIARQLEITDIQWNSNGLTIAASYGNLEHEGTCYHKGFIYAWNISKRDFNPAKPSLVIETNVNPFLHLLSIFESCIMCLSFHGSKPNILAAGSFSGEVQVFDISGQEGAIEMGKSSVDEYFHRESVTQLCWADVKLHQSPLATLISLGCDGKILMWPIDFENHKENLKYPLKGLHLLRKKENQIESVGGICFSQCIEDPHNFIIGSEGGSVLRGLVTPFNLEKKNQLFNDSRDKGFIWKEEALHFMNNINQKYLPEIKQQVEEYCKRRQINEIYIQHILSAKPDIRKLFINPIAFAYEAHYGSVFGISNSPFLKDVFLTISMDGQARLYDQLNARSIVTYEYFSTYLLSGQFSPIRPCVFAITTSNGDILFYDLKQNKKHEALILKPVSIGSNQSATNLRFNSRQLDLLACSYQGAIIKIYQLSDQLAQYQKGEEEIFTKFLNEQKQ